MRGFSEELGLAFDCGFHVHFEALILSGCWKFNDLK